MSDAAAQSVADPQTAPRQDSQLLEVEYYTDPICCWCWAFEPVWQRLRSAMGPAMRRRYRMAGLVRDWSSYEDPLNVVHRPAQMGPLCTQVRHMTGTKINDLVWVTDPPESSWPACIAVKAAALQSPEAEEIMLMRLREALMLHGRNIARQTVLMELADDVAAHTPFDIDRFKIDLAGAQATAAFREDLGDIAFRHIGRYPALAVRHHGGKGALIVGYRPWEALREVLKGLWPDLGL